MNAQPNETLAEKAARSKNEILAAFGNIRPEVGGAHLLIHGEVPLIVAGDGGRAEIFSPW